MTISEIKKTMTDAFIADANIQSVYNLDPTKTFEEQFSSVSLENILFYIVACCNWVSQQMFDRHRQDITDILHSEKSHTLNWYANRSLEFEYGRDIDMNTGKYDDTNLTPQDLDKLHIVKHATVMENKDGGITVKVAGENGNQKSQLNDDQVQAFQAYLRLIKDAGVKIGIINSKPDDLKASMMIYYDPLILNSKGQRLDKADDKPVVHAIQDFIGNLPFDGIFTTQALVDTLQQVDGVLYVSLEKGGVWTKRNDETDYSDPVETPVSPYAGYYLFDEKSSDLRYSTLSGK